MTSGCESLLLGALLFPRSLASSSERGSHQDEELHSSRCDWASRRQATVLCRNEEPAPSLPSIDTRGTMTLSGARTDEIALALGRSKAVVQSRANEFEISLKVVKITRPGSITGLG
jgi:hypothetical protein